MLRPLLALPLVLASAFLPYPALAEPFRLILTHLEPPLVPNSVMDLAHELGYFENEGVEVDLIRVQQTPSALAALSAGEGDMANIGLDALLQLHARGQTDLVAVASPNKSLPFLIAARETIAIPFEQNHSFAIGRVGSLDHGLSLNVLDALGAETSAIEFVALGQPSVRAQALAAGQIDMTTMSIGVWLAMPDKSGLEILVDPDTYYEAAPVVQKVNVVSREVLETRREDIEAVLRALIALSRDFAADPDFWAEAIAPYAPQLSDAERRELSQSFAQSWSVNGGLNADELQFSQDWLFETPDFDGLDPAPITQWTAFAPLDTVLETLGEAPDFDPPAR